MDMGFGFAGFNVGVMAFMQYDVGFTLDSLLRGALKEADSVRAGTAYTVIGDGVAQAGFAPTVSYAGRLTKGAGGDDSDDGVYLGAALHWYMGATYGRGQGPAGFTTGTPVFGTTPTVVLDYTVYSSNKAFGQGFGGDVGVVWISGPFEVGVGMNDIGAELTWKDTKVQQVYYETASGRVRDSLLVNHIETKTKLPITYIANAALRMGTATTVGGDVINSGRGTVIHVGAEQRIGPFALRGGVSRDQRKKIQFGWGGGLRLGPIGLDVGFWTHSSSFAAQRGIMMATSISVY
jgi:hypothetical protein